MRLIAPDVHQLSLAPRDALNAYLVGDVLIDAGVASSAKRIVAGLAGRPLAAHALTHVHPDHAGGSRRVLDAREVPVWVGARDAEAMRRGEPEPAPGRGSGLMRFAFTFGGVDVDRELREGDELAAGFVVLDVPGHSPGTSRSGARRTGCSSRATCCSTSTPGPCGPGCASPCGS
jgi:glyoxylase-like metal-dependent hydrolase (beta-lactamase superfamily II)